MLAALIRNIACRCKNITLAEIFPFYPLVQWDRKLKPSYGHAWCSRVELAFNGRDGVQRQSF
jgi:hypothetical protein